MIENEDIAVELVEQMAEARRFAPKTACGYKSVARQWCASIGSTPFAAATEEDAAGWLASCGAMSGKTIYHRLCVMRRLYRYAVRSGAVLSNPFDSETLEVNYRKVELDITRQDPVEPWEIERILAYATRVCASRETSRSVWLRTVLDNAIARLHIVHSLSFPDISRLRICDFADGYAAGAMKVTATLHRPRPRHGVGGARGHRAAGRRRGRRRPIRHHGRSEAGQAPLVRRAGQQD